MDKCKQSPPALYRERFDRVAACYLYEDHEVLPGELLGDLFKEIDSTTKGATAQNGDAG